MAIRPAPMIRRAATNTYRTNFTFHAQNSLLAQSLRTLKSVSIRGRIWSTLTKESSRPGLSIRSNQTLSKRNFHHDRSILRSVNQRHGSVRSVQAKQAVTLLLGGTTGQSSLSIIPCFHTRMHMQRVIVFLSMRTCLLCTCTRARPKGLLHQQRSLVEEA